VAAEVSEREAEVLAALGAHLTNAEIARKLFISVRTVESHVSSLLRKLGAPDRRALAALAEQERVRAESGAPPLGEIAGVPSARTTFVGRVAEREAVLAALGSARVLTLLGPGGVGKTRLASVIAKDAAPAFPLGGAFVDLVPVRDGYVWQAVAAALGVTEHAQQSLEQAVKERLARGRSLVVLDNCEHLVDAAAGFVDDVLEHCPDVTVLATSRERLGVSGERIVALAPLPLTSDAELLFTDRATDVDPTFTADPAVIAQLCARLDGMPLAIELAAARSASLGTEGLLAGLDDALRLLAGGRGANERHRSLRAVLDWSYRLLDDDEQRMFRRLGVFVGGFDLAAARDVAADGDASVAADLIGRLADKSLVVRRQGAGGWRLLETVRAFAADLLAATDEHADVRGRHLRWSAAVAAGIEAELAGEWRASFDAVVDDLRAALAGAEPAPVAHGLARSLGRLCFARRFLSEALAHYRRAVELAPDARAAAADLRSASDCAHVAVASPLAFELLLASARRMDDADPAAKAVALARVVEVADRFHTFFDTRLTDDELRALLAEARSAGDPADPVVAAALAIATAWNAGPAKMAPDVALAERALAAARATGDPFVVCSALDAMSAAFAQLGRLREAHGLTRERMALVAGMDRTDPRYAPEIEDAFHVAAISAIAAGDLPFAERIARQVRADELIGEHPYISATSLVPALVLTGQMEEAFGAADHLWEFFERAGRPVATWMAPVLSAAALGHGLIGDEHGLALWRARTAEIARSAGVESPDHAPFAAFVAARTAVRNGWGRDAPALVEAAFAPVVMSGRYWPYAHAAGAELAVVAGLPDAEERLAGAARAAAENDWAAACVARAAGRLHDDPDALATAIAGWERIDARLERAVTLLLIPDRAPEGEAALAALTPH
jgi:predicted ATPase/DNA-binding CsgD family transcriptional regulator